MKVQGVQHQEDVPECPVGPYAADRRKERADNGRDEHHA